MENILLSLNVVKIKLSFFFKGDKGNKICTDAPTFRFSSVDWKISHSNILSKKIIE